MSSDPAFGELALQVRAAGLMERRRGYYLAKIGCLVAMFVGGWAVLVVVGSSWASLGIAAFLGTMSAQLGFIGHDAGHQQVFASRRANRCLGLVVGNGLIGLCFGWWVPKHSAHHARPNEVGRDPDIADALFFSSWEQARSRVGRGVARFLERWQAPLFFPLMVLRSLGLHVSGARYLVARRDRVAAVEAVLVVAHLALYVCLVVLLLRPLQAVAFVAVEQVVFSLYLGCSFAPNHKAMPIVPAGGAMGFARRQVLTSRNVTGGRVTTFVLGGLNYQIEHHLFPAMPRPNLRRAQHLVRAFCLATGLGYCEASFLESCCQITRELGAAGRAAMLRPVAS